MTGELKDAAVRSYVAGKYAIDTLHTFVSFMVSHFVISHVEGRFNNVTGDFTLAIPFTDSTANVTVEIASIDTGVPMRDQDLRSKNFFEAEKYPAMTFESRSISGMPESFTVLGALTIKDVTKNVQFSGKYNGSLKDPRGYQRAALQVTGKVNRRDFHIDHEEPTVLGPGIGDEVTINISIDGTLREKP